MGFLTQALVEEYGVSEVTMVTGRPNYPEGKIPDELKFTFFARCVGRHGEKVHHLYEFPAAFNTRVRKTLGLLSFGVSTFFYFLFRKIKKEDLIIVTSGPVFPLFSILFLKKFKRKIRFVLDVRDLWPEALAAMGLMKKDSLHYRSMFKKLQKAYTSAEGIIGNSPGIVEQIKSYQPEVNISLLLNPVDLDLFVGDEGVKREEPCQFFFHGTHAAYSDLMLWMEVIREISEEGQDFSCLLVGQGESKAELQAYVEKHDLNKWVRFESHMSKPELVKYIQAADVCYSSVKNDEGLRYMLPTKIPEYLACAKFVLYAVHEPFDNFLKELAIESKSFKVGDKNSLKTAMIELIEERPAGYIEKNRKAAEEIFAVDRFKLQVVEQIKPYLEAGP